MDARNALLEARSVVGPGHDPWVLEPSPPAVVDGEWFADDPVEAGDLDWREWVGAHPEHAGWAADRLVPAFSPPGPIPGPLPVDAEAARFVGDWYGFAWSVLEALRAEPASADAGRVQLWPEHFDAAFDFRVRDGRVTFGASPGDAAADEPYLYVLPAGEVPRSDLWNACSFNGAVLPVRDLVGEADQRPAALEFFRTHRAPLL